MNRVCIVSFLIISFNLQGQNLIQNWSFEDTIPFDPWNPNIYGPDAAFPWFTPPSCGGSPDYFSESYYQFPINQVPNNSFGYQFPKTGIAYCGFMPYVQSNPNYRERISYGFGSPLAANHIYYLNFYVNCGDYANQALDVIGAYFSVDTPDFCLGMIYTPQVVNPPGNIIADTVNWVPISGSFVAAGGEKVMTITNFYTDANTQLYQFPNGTIQSAYYYIDDVTLIDCTAVGITEQQQIAFILLQNPVVNSVCYTSPFKINAAKVYNTLGVVVKECEFATQSNYKIDVADLPRGIYFLQAQTKDKKRGVKKFVKQ